MIILAQQLGTSLDLSMHVFQQLVDDVDIGRVHDIHWWWS